MQSLLSAQIFIQNSSYFRQDFGSVTTKKRYGSMSRTLLTCPGLKCRKPPPGSSSDPVSKRGCMAGGHARKNNG